MTDGYTPGPWRVDGQFDAAIAIITDDADEFPICELEPLCEDWTQEEIATAHLIAAAPDLLGALKRAELPHGKGCAVAALCPCSCGLAAAIAKAEEGHA